MVNTSQVAKLLKENDLNGAPGRIRTSGLLIRSYSTSGTCHVYHFWTLFTFSHLQGVVSIDLGVGTRQVPVNTLHCRFLGWAKVGQVGSVEETRWDNGCRRTHHAQSCPARRRGVCARLHCGQQQALVCWPGSHASLPSAVPCEVALVAL